MFSEEGMSENLNWLSSIFSETQQWMVSIYMLAHGGCLLRSTKSQTRFVFTIHLGGTIHRKSKFWPQLAKPHDLPPTQRGWLILSLHGGERHCLKLCLGYFDPINVFFCAVKTQNAPGCLADTSAKTKSRRNTIQVDDQVNGLEHGTHGEVMTLDTVIWSFKVELDSF